jgi:hypothetical protein
MISPILHIGFPKTSSTWFQESFYPHINNIFYLPRNTVQDLFIRPGAFDWNEQDCKKQLEILTSGNTKRIVICEELLLGRLRPGGVKHFVTKEIANRLKLVFREATIVLFIRNQMDAIASAYLQYIQSGGNYSINKFINPNKISGGDYNSLVLLGPDYFQYHKVIDHYAELFGQENVQIFLYEDFRDSNKLFIDAFKEKFNFLIDERQLSCERVNESYRALLVAPRKFCNAFTRKGPLNKYYILHIPYIDRIIRLVFAKANKYRIFGNRRSAEKILGRKNLKYLQSFYRQSNRILIEKYGLTSISSYHYPL